MNNEVIVVKQLPEIEERLQTIKADVTERVNEAMSLVCAEDTVQAVKKRRAELNSEFKDWEEKRKEVKKVIMSPYEQFEVTYKDCITDVYKKADADLKGKIDSVENELKENRRKELKEYFDEYLAAAEAVTGISLTEFITFEKANINITLSASNKSLKEQVKTFIDRICDDLNLIGVQEHKDEIFYEYKQSMNVSAAITTVANRYKAIEEAKKREEEHKAKKEAAKAAAEKVVTVVETLTPPTVVDEPIKEQILTLHFTVKGTRAQLKALKEFLKNNNYDFE